MDELKKYKISISDVVDAISRSNTNAGGRPIEIGNQYLIIQGKGMVSDIEDIKNIVIDVRNGFPIKVSDVASVKRGNVPRTGIVGLNNKDDIVMGIVVIRKDAKSIPAISSVHQKIKELNERILPKGLKIVPFYERGKLVYEVIKKVVEIAIIGIILVFVSIFIFLGDLKSAIFTSLIVPFSLIISLGIMSIKGESASFLSIAAIDFGIIVDLALLYIEDYFRLLDKVGSPQRAIMLSAEETTSLLIFSILIIMISFIPIFLMEGAEKQIS